nr:ArlX2 [Paratrimastix pyriformis]
MGSCMSRKVQSKSIVICGLNGVGKTTLCRRIFSHAQTLPNTVSDPADPSPEGLPPVPAASDEEMAAVPTIGVDTIPITVGGKTFNILDMSGQQAFRVHWQRFQEKTSLIVYVVDASDLAKMDEASETLHKLILNQPALARVPLSIVGNKNDIAGALTSEQLVQRLFPNGIKVDGMKDREFNCLSTSAKTGEGVREVLDWFLQRAS